MLLQAGTVPPPLCPQPRGLSPRVCGHAECHGASRKHSHVHVRSGAGHRSPYTVSADSKGIQALAGSPAQKSSIPHVRAGAAGGLARGRGLGGERLLGLGLGGLNGQVTQAGGPEERRVDFGLQSGLLGAPDQDSPRGHSWGHLRGENSTRPGEREDPGEVTCRPSLWAPLGGHWGHGAGRV